MIKTFGYLRLKDWVQAALSIGFIVVQVWLDLKLPDYMQEITVMVQTPGSEMSAIWRSGGYMLLCTLGSVIASVIVGYFAARIGAAFSRRLRSELFGRVESFSMEEIDRFSTASLITRSTNDITQVQMFVTMALQMIARAPIMAVWAVTKIAGKGFEWSLATGVAVLALFVLIGFVLLFVFPKFRKMQKLTDNINRVTRENLKGLRVVRAYNAEGFEERKFGEANEELTAVHLFVSRAMSVMMPSMTIIMGGLNLSIYWIGAYLINAAGIEGRLTLFSDMVVFSAYAMQIIMSFIMMVALFIILPRAAVSARRIHEVLDTEPAIKDGTRDEGVSGLAGEVEFRNVSFKYPGAKEYVLEDVSFKAGQGETVAFIGSTGSGKSTLINLVPRFFDPTEGEVLVNGVNIKEYRLESLYEKIGYVPQQAVMFMGTVSSNVAFGSNAMKLDAEGMEREVKRAVGIAQGAEFVEKMEEGYGSQIAQGGTNISGGQKQRLAIARAVCRKPEIYIFDDSFSALDYKTDRVLRTVLKKETAGVTSLIVGQRIGTIMDADRIVVLDRGRVAGIGRHRELLKSCEVYLEIAMSQLSKEELENA